MCAIGCECGYLKVARTSIGASDPEVMASWELQVQGPISCLRFFSLPNDMHPQTPSEDTGKHQRNLQ